MAKIVNICDVCTEIFAGGDAPKGRISKSQTLEYPIPIYSNGEENAGLYGFTDVARVTAPSVTVSARGTIGYAAIRTEPFVPIVRLITLVPDQSKIGIKYLYYAVQNYKFEGSGTSIPQLTVPILKKYNFPLPSKEEQQSVVSVLDKVNELIALRKEQLAKLDQLVKSRFVELFGDPVKNDMGWESKLLNDVCDGIGDGLHGTPVYDDYGEYPFINGNNLNDGKIVITPATKMVAAETYEKHFIKISLNAILISINGTLGKLAFYNGEKVMLGKSACYCNLRQNINKVFVYGVMKSDAFAEFLENSSTKSTIKNVGLKAMREFKLILPPKELQEQFAAFVEQTDKSKAAIQQSLDKLELLKKALMQEYFG